MHEGPNETQKARARLEENVVRREIPMDDLLGMPGLNALKLFCGLR